MEQAVQIVAALTVLSAFVMVQRRTLVPDSYTYLLMNFAGTAVLAVLAYRGEQWGFLMLNTVWCLVSALGLGMKLRGQ